MSFIEQGPKPHFKDLSLLGEGSNSCVYKANRQVHPNLPAHVVAVKVFKNTQEIQNFENKFQELARLRSKYFPAVLGWELFSEGPAIIMDCVDGVSLEELMKLAPLCSSTKTEIVAQVQNGLIELKAHGLRHGDISPANILVDKTGQIKIIDFNLFNEGDGTIHGTPEYLAPERWVGDVPSFESDLFALGVIASELFGSSTGGREGLPQLRERAAALSEVPSTSLLTAEKALRKPDLQFFEDQKARVLLGEIVSKVFQQKSRLPMRTKILEIRCARQKKNRLYEMGRCSRAIGITLLLLGICLPVRSGVVSTLLGPRFVSQALGGRIEIRTQKWIEVEINGHKLGYSPLLTDPLAEGRYLLKWRNKRQHGAFVVYIKRGEVLNLKDENFAGNRIL